MSKWETIGKSDEWYTPAYIFNALGVTFDLDVAAPTDRKYCTVPATNFINDKSLESEWRGFVWMNPPFGGRNHIAKWLNKLADHGNGIALTPDRTSTEWWQDAANKAHSVLFVKGKIKFLRPDGTTGNSPSTGTTLFAYGKQGVIALENASNKDLGLLVELF